MKRRSQEISPLFPRHGLFYFGQGYYFLLKLVPKGWLGCFKIKDWKTIQYFHVWNFNGDTFLDFFETLCDKMKNIGLFVVRGRRVCNRPSTFNNVHLVSITWQSDIIVLNEPWMLCYIHWLIVLYAQSAFKVFGLEKRQLRPIHKATFLSCSFFSHWRYMVEFSRKPIFTFFKVEPSFVFLQS